MNPYPNEIRLVITAEDKEKAIEATGNTTHVCLIAQACKRQLGWTDPEVGYTFALDSLEERYLLDNTGTDITTTFRTRWSDIPVPQTITLYKSS